MPSGLAASVKAAPLQTRITPRPPEFWLLCLLELLKLRELHELLLIYFSKLPYVSWVWSCEVTCVRATANSPCSGEWSDRWERERLLHNLLRPNLGFWRPQVTSGWLIWCKTTLVDRSEKKNKRGKTLTTVYQHHEQSYSSAHGGVRRQRGSICSRSFTVRFCQRCWFSSCQEASYRPSPQSESFSERGSQRYSSVGFWTGKTV